MANYLSSSIFLVIVILVQSEKAIGEILQSSDQIFPGEWKVSGSCPQDSYIQGFSVQWDLESRLMEQIRFHCSQPKHIGRRSRKSFDVIIRNDSRSSSSGYNNSGMLSKPLYCERGLVIGTQFLIEVVNDGGTQNQHVKNIALLCSDGSLLLTNENTNLNGKWLNPKECSKEKSICGAKPQFRVNGEDHKTLAALHFDCCNIPHPASTCHVKVKSEAIAECSNIESEATKTCIYEKITGINYFNEHQLERKIYEELGFTLESSISILREKFYDASGDSTFDMISTNETIEAESGEIVKIFQEIQTCGIYKWNSNKIGTVQKFFNRNQKRETIVTIKEFNEDEVMLRDGFLSSEEDDFFTSSIDAGSVKEVETKKNNEAKSNEEDLWGIETESNGNDPDPIDPASEVKVTKVLDAESSSQSEIGKQIENIAFHKEQSSFELDSIHSNGFDWSEKHEDAFESKEIKQDDKNSDMKKNMPLPAQNDHSLISEEIGNDKKIDPIVQVSENDSIKKEQGSNNDKIDEVDTRISLDKDSDSNEKKFSDEQRGIKIHAVNDDLFDAIEEDEDGSEYKETKQYEGNTDVKRNMTLPAQKVHEDKNLDANAQAFINSQKNMEQAQMDEIYTKINEDHDPNEMDLKNNEHGTETKPFPSDPFHWTNKDVGSFEHGEHQHDSDTDSDVLDNLPLSIAEQSEAKISEYKAMIRRNNVDEDRNAEIPLAALKFADEEDQPVDVIIPILNQTSKDEIVLDSWEEPFSSLLTSEEDDTSVNGEDQRGLTEERAGTIILPSFDENLGISANLDPFVAGAKELADQIKSNAAQVRNEVEKAVNEVKELPIVRQGQKNVEDALKTAAETVIYNLPDFNEQKALDGPPSIIDEGALPPEGGEDSEKQENVKSGGFVGWIVGGMMIAVVFIVIIIFLLEKRSERSKENVKKEDYAENPPPEPLLTSISVPKDQS